MKGCRASAIGLLLLAIGILPARAANLVADPGFESCTTVGGSPPPGWTGTAFCDGQVHSGSWAALFVAPVGTPETLSQSISTSTGATYEFSFWLEQLALPPTLPNDFVASFGADEVLDLTNVAAFPYTSEDFTVMATTASTTISFVGAAQNATWALDDVSVTRVGLLDATAL